MRRSMLHDFVQIVFVVLDDAARHDKEMSHKNWKENDETDLSI